jgi:hypothetical protein
MKPVLAVLRNVGISIGSNVNKYKRLIAFACIVIIGPPSYGTTVIFIRRGTTIWIAADSQQTGFDQFGNKKAVRFQCKLIKENSFYWASSTNYYADSTGFSIQKLVQAAKGNTLHEIAANLADTAKQPILDEVENVENQIPPEKRRTTDAAMLFGTVLFLGLDDQKPAVFIVRFTVQRTNRKETVRSDGPIPFTETSVGGGIGIFDEGLDYMTAHRAEIASNPIGILRNSVLQEEHKFPDDIGGKMSILQLSSDGFRWIENGECSD